LQKQGGFLGQWPPFQSRQGDCFNGANVLEGSLKDGNSFALFRNDKMSGG
jgi:hypothetical protein